MSHPCGSYDKNTLRILKNLNIKIGFIPNMLYRKRNNFTANNFEIAREDHSNIKRKIDLKRVS